MWYSQSYDFLPPLLRSCECDVHGQIVFEAVFFSCSSLVTRGSGKHVSSSGTNVTWYHVLLKSTKNYYVSIMFQIFGGRLQHNLHLDNWDRLQDQDHRAEREEDQASDMGHCWPGSRKTSFSHVDKFLLRIRRGSTQSPPLTTGVPWVTRESFRTEYEMMHRIVTFP